MNFISKIKAVLASLIKKDRSLIKGASKLPKYYQWKQFFSILSKKEKIIFLGLCLVFFSCFIPFSLNFYKENTVSVPAKGGIFREGILGQPKFVNPLYLSSQDADRDIIEILFSGLMKYNGNGELVNDLASDYQVKEGGKVVGISLKDNLFWHDGKPLTADDVVFTVNLVQEPQSQSPLRIQWVGVLVEKVSDSNVLFRLPKNYAGFRENLVLKILPKHIFENIAPKDLLWDSAFENYLVGSGPFKFKKIVQTNSSVIQKLVLERNSNYYGEAPYINGVEFIFYEKIADLLKAEKVGDIDGFALSDPGDISNAKNGFKNYFLLMPRYFALFFNLKKDSVFADASLREAMNYAIDRETILKIFSNQARVAVSPILPDFFGLKEPANPVAFDPEKAGQILDGLGYAKNPQTGKRENKTSQGSLFTFNRNLFFGNIGEDVNKLQECLAKFSDIYPEAKITGEFGVQTKAAVIKFQEKYAEEILKPNGLTKGNGDVKQATRTKLNEICFPKSQDVLPLKFTLTTCDKFPLAEISQIVQKNLEDIGVAVEINKLSLSDFQTEALNKRNFEFLLFGEALGAIPDPFPFWHSSQKDYPGLNISSYIEKQADSLLEKARETQDIAEQENYLEQFQDILLSDVPAVFLASPDYVYMLSGNVRGFATQKITEPAKRFSTIEKWYLKTKRVWR